MSEQANGWFYKEAVKNERKSAEEKRAVFDEVVMVMITIPGDNKNKFVDIANDEYKERFPAAWKQYEASEAQVGEGTPLEEWPLMTVGRCKELKSLNIHSVEQLAELPDQFISRLGMGGRELVEQAKVRVLSSDSDAEKLAQQVKDLTAEVEALKSDGGGSEGSTEAEKETIAIQERQIKNLQADVETLTAEKSSLSESNQSLQNLFDEEKAKTTKLEADIEALTTPQETPKAEDAAKGDGAKVDAKAAEDEEKSALRAQIKEKTGSAVKGNPSLETLRKMAAE